METDSEVPLSLLCLIFLVIYIITLFIQYSSRSRQLPTASATNTTTSNPGQLIDVLKYIPIVGLSVCGSYWSLMVVDIAWVALIVGFSCLLVAVFIGDLLINKLTQSNFVWVNRCSDYVFRLVSPKRYSGSGSSTLNGLVSGQEQTVNLVDSLELTDSILDEKDKEMLRSIIRLDVSTAREIMVPRLDMIAVEMNATIDDVVELFLSSGHSRLPVYEDTIDRVTGVVHARDILGVLAIHDHDAVLADFIRSAFFIPESKRLDGLLQEMQEKSIQFAIVVDEYGGTEGLVTMEDLLEEIVGELEDEFSSTDSPVTQFSDGSAIVDAGVTTEDVQNLFRINLHDPDVDTIGGYVYRSLGRIPMVGDIVSANQLNIEVLSVLGRRLRKLRVKPILETDNPG